MSEPSETTGEDGPDLSLSEDRTRLRITFPPIEAVGLPVRPATVCSLNYTAEQVDEMLHGLANWRMAMVPPHPADFAPGQKVTVTPGPSWRSEPDAMADGVILHLRHPGFGWLHFVLPKRDCATLGESLLVRAEADPEPPPSRKN